MGGINSDTKLALHFEGVDESNEFQDSGNTGHVIDKNNSPVMTKATVKVGVSALRLGITPNLTQIADHADWDFGVGDFCIECWVNLDDVDVNGVIIAHTNYTAGNDGWALAITNVGAGSIQFLAMFAGGWGINIEELHGMSNGTWHHVCVERVSGDIDIYIDGTSIYSATHADDITGGAMIVAIGRDPNNVAYFLPGYLDLLRITKGAYRYNGNFTPPTSAPDSDADTVLLLNYEPLDDSNSKHLTVFSGTAKIDTAQAKWGSASLYLDGNSDYVTVPAHADFDIIGSTGDDWTIDCFIMMNTHAGSDVIIGQRQDAQNNWRLLHEDSGGAVDGLRLNVIIGGVETINIGGGEIGDNNWHHIAMCKVANEIGLYVDGTQIAYTAFADTVDLTAEDLIIGMANSASYFDGWIDELRVQNSNIFDAAPNNVPNDTIVVPVAAYSATKGGPQAVIIA